jgi:hypothetical protein
VIVTRRDAADWVGVRVAAICALDTNTGCIKGVVPVKAADDRPRSGARGEALWAPVGDHCTGGHFQQYPPTMDGRHPHVASESPAACPAYGPRK